LILATTLMISIWTNLMISNILSKISHLRRCLRNSNSLACLKLAFLILIMRSFKKKLINNLQIGKCNSNQKYLKFWIPLKSSLRRPQKLDLLLTLKKNIKQMKSIKCRWNWMLKVICAICHLTWEKSIFNLNFKLKAVMWKHTCKERFFKI
jgi:hypothetical protein